MEIPQRKADVSTVSEWFVVVKELANLKSREALLRSFIFNSYFPDPVEGTNTTELDAEANLKAVHTINRTVIMEELNKLKEALKTPVEGSNMPEIPLDKLLKWKPEVVISEYRKLSDDQRMIFDLCLNVKPGTPQLEVKLKKAPA